MPCFMLDDAPLGNQGAPASSRTANGARPNEPSDRTPRRSCCSLAHTLQATLPPSWLFPDGAPRRRQARGPGQLPMLARWIWRRNSWLVLVARILSTTSSSACAGSSAPRTRRSFQATTSSSSVSSSSSLRVEEPSTSSAGKMRRSESLRSSRTSMFPVALNSSKMTSSMREPVSTSAVARIVSEPPSSMLRAAPRKRLGGYRAEESTPPDRILPLAGVVARPVEGRVDHLRLGGALHVGDLFRPLVDEQDDEDHLGVVGADRVGDLLHQGGLAGLWRRHDQATLPLADRGHDVHDPRGDLRRRVLEPEPLVGVQGGEVLEVLAVAGDLGLHAVDLVDPHKRRVLLGVTGQLDHALDLVAAAQARAPDHRQRHVDVVGARQVAVDPQEAVAVLRADVERADPGHLWPVVGRRGAVARVGPVEDSHVALVAAEAVAAAVAVAAPAAALLVAGLVVPAPAALLVAVPVAPLAAVAALVTVLALLLALGLAGLALVGLALAVTAGGL